MGSMISADVKANVGTIESNLEAVKESILAKTEEYKAVVFTEDQITEGKKFLADIRKEQKALDQQRKDIKREWMKPYERFEKQAKEIIALYDEPIKAVNDQLSEYEARRVEEKNKEIRAIYEEEKGDLEEWVPLARIWVNGWKNKGYTANQIRVDIRDCFDQMKFSIDTIRGMHSEFEADALEILKATGDVREALAEITALKEQKERFEEAARRKAEQEMQAKLEAERRKIAEEERTKAAQEAASAAESVEEKEPEEDYIEARKEAQEATEGDGVPFDADEMPFATMDEPEEASFVHVMDPRTYVRMSVLVPVELVGFVREFCMEHNFEFTEEGDEL